MKKILTGVLVVAIAAGSMSVAFAAEKTARPKAGQKVEQRADNFRGKAEKIHKIRSGLIKWVKNLKDENLTSEEKALKDEIITLDQKLVDDTADLRAQLKSKLDELKAVLKSEDMSKEDKEAAIAAAKPEIKAINDQIRAIAQPIEQEIKTKVKQLRELIKADKAEEGAEPTAASAADDVL